MSFWYKIAAVFISVAVFQVLVPNWYQVVIDVDAFSFGRLGLPEEIEGSDGTRQQILFFGDVMLARNVERLMNIQGQNYPFAGFRPGAGVYAVANLETAVPAEHVPTPSNTFRFSTPVRSLQALKEANFSHLSLANNHSFDYGLAGYNHTVSSLWDAGLVPFGHPSVVDQASITYMKTAIGQVAIIAAHTLYVVPSDEEIIATVVEAAKQSVLQVLYIHWGDEYELTQSAAQRRLATKFAEAGIDLIIGHHPHVVQGVEQIGTTLVFYSLGNYIFDQYFSPDVETGLVLELSLSDRPVITLIPVTSAENRSQPRPYSAESKASFLESLAERSAPELRDAILAGAISLPESLATSE